MELSARLRRRAANRPASGAAALMVAATLLISGCETVGPATSPPPARPGIEPPAQPTGGQLMSGADVRSILTRARYRWEGTGGATGTATTTPDGRIRVIWDTGAANGRIRFTDTGYCSRFDGIRNGAEDCYRLFRTGPGTYDVQRLDGTRSGRIQILG